MSGREKDPPDSQVRILFGRAGLRCSYPDCGIKLVIGGRVRGDQPKNVAKVAHITAASKGGPRYDPSLTSEERRSEPNLMLLCGPHHDAVDTQLNLHTVQWLKDAKTAHEKSLDRGKRYAMGEIGYRELEMVCKALTMPGASGDDVIAEIPTSMDIADKIEYNRLGDKSRGLIELGMAQDREVWQFLKDFDRMMPGFAEGLTAQFKAIYFQGVADRLSPDEQFDAIIGAAYENCGVQLTDAVAAAALAVVAHLFSICEIFKHEPAVA